jgi:hypothetical protein
MDDYGVHTRLDFFVCKERLKSYDAEVNTPKKEIA